jgi:pSer/pThr/pTyr-binding forkhead associated (FHA) protein
MKLLFPGGEHAPVELPDGKTIIGSAPDARIVLMAPGIAPHHAEIECAGVAGKITAIHPDNELAINGKPVSGTTELKPGDQISFAAVRARAVAVEKAAPAPAPRAREPEVADDGRTKVRMALPKFVLRGVSGITFGKIFPVHGTVVIGRQSECEISIPSEEVSRRHAELRLTPDGVMVEDMGSSNGTYVNDRRVTRQLMKAGDELRLDTIRFLLLAPGQDINPTAARPDTGAAAAGAAKPAAAGSRNGLMWAIVVVAVGCLAAVGAKIAGLF